MSNLKVSFFAALSLAFAMLMPEAVSAQQVQVTSATPSEAPQGTISLDVTVAGSGFDSSAQVTFLVTGTTNPGGIVVRKVKVTGPKKLIATIDIADAATVSRFDIEVALSGGRKGKGTSLFAVLAKANDPCAAPGIDFPAFTFWKLSGSMHEIMVSDSTGSCVKPLVQIAFGGPTHTFSYPVGSSTNRGRIVWLGYGGVLTGRDFTVNPDRSLTLEPVVEILTAPYGALELNTSGTTLYFSDTDSVLDLRQIYRIPLPEQLSSGTPIAMELLYSVPYPSVGIGNIEFISINRDETRLYASRWVLTYPDAELIRIDLDKPGRPVTVVASPGFGTPYADADMPAVLSSSASGDRVVFTDRIAGLDHCYLLRVIQANQDGTVVLENNFIRYGRYSTTLDGHIVTTGYKPPNKRGRCDETGIINRIDPDSGTELSLVRGLSADGR